LSAAFSTEEAMKGLVQDLKKTNTALKIDDAYSIVKTAASIAEYRPDQVTNPAELLLWLVEVRVPQVVIRVDIVSLQRVFASLSVSIGCAWM
jgi:hypothetical protein